MDHQKVVDDKEVPANLKKPKAASAYDDLKKHEDLGDYYKLVEKLRAAKSETYSWESAAPSLPEEETLEGKQMEKNKRKKNPRKIYRHDFRQAACMERIRSFKKLTGFYGGERSARKRAPKRVIFYR